MVPGLDEGGLIRRSSRSSVHHKSVEVVALIRALPKQLLIVKCLLLCCCAFVASVGLCQLRGSCRIGSHAAAQVEQHPLLIICQHHLC